MERAEEWARCLELPILTEEEYQNMQHHPVEGPLTKPRYMGVDQKTLDEVQAILSQWESHGEYTILLGVLPPNTGPDDLVPSDSRFAFERWRWDNPVLREARKQVRLVMRSDLHP